MGTRLPKHKSKPFPERAVWIRAPGRHDDEPYPVRQSNFDPTGVNYKDCKDDIHLLFTLEINSASACSDQIQVWAGTGSTDCTQSYSRQLNSGDPQCWPVTPLGAFQMMQSSTGYVRVRDLAAFVNNPEPPGLYARQDDIAACQSQAAPASIPVNIYFMAMNGLAVDGFTMYSLDVGLVGPYPPQGISAGIGENLIVVKWTPAVDATIQGFNIHCEDLGTYEDAGLSDAAPEEATLVCPATTASDGATDVDACVYVNPGGSGAAEGTSCASRDLVDTYVNGTSAVDGGEAGLVPPVETDADTEASAPAGAAVGISEIPSTYLCGTVTGNGQNRAIVESFLDGGTSIKDGTRYAVAVAAFDGIGNVGILSDLACVTPARVTTFWDRCVIDGCAGGGGFCSLLGPGLPAGGSLFGIGIGATALAFARHRRKVR